MEVIFSILFMQWEVGPFLGLALKVGGVLFQQSNPLNADYAFGLERFTFRKHRIGPISPG